MNVLGLQHDRVRRLVLFGLILIGTLIAFSGCLSMDIAKMEPAQLKALEGIATCNKTAVSAYGQSVTVIVKDGDVRKGATGKSKITITPDCSTTIENDVGVAPVPVRAE